VTDAGGECAPVNSENWPQLVAAPSIIALIYELLDAHDDTARLAEGLLGEPVWTSHLEYLRRLQRMGRETLARTSLKTPTATQRRPSSR